MNHLLPAKVGGDIALSMINELVMGPSDDGKNKSTWRPSWGGHFVAGNGLGLVRAQFTRVQTGGQSAGPVDALEVRICGHHWLFAACSVMNYYRAPLTWNTPESQGTFASHASTLCLVLGIDVDAITKGAVP